jgi:hypothetical protein
MMEFATALGHFAVRLSEKPRTSQSIIFAFCNLSDAGPAMALDLTIPLRLLARADKVIK